MEVDLLGAMIAGLVGTVAMMLFVYIGPLIGMDRMDIIGLLGSVFSGKKIIARALGVIVHLVMGAIFGLLYGFLWSLGVGSPTWGSGLLFGLGHGVVVSIMIPWMLQAHPRNPTLERSLLWVVGFLLAHLVFGIATALTYAPFHA